MRQAGVLPGGMFWVPGSAAKMDRYGNISTGQIVQIVSALKGIPGDWLPSQPIEPDGRTCQ